MKHYFARLACYGLILGAATPSRTVGQEKPGVLGLCELVDHWTDYNHKKVRVRAVFAEGREQSFLYDPDCRRGEGLTAIEFGKSAERTTKRLDTLLANNHRASVIFEGTFYGPEPYDKIDPKLPATIRERLARGHKRYGHLNTFDTMIEVTRIVEATEASADVAPLK